jgi:hypothetical protein
MKLYTNFDNFINEAKVMKQKDTAKIAQKLASALSKADGKEFTISKDSLDAGGWDLDMDGEEFAGGTYFIGDAGEIVNAATSNDVYGHMDDSEAELVKKIKKGKFAKYRATESLDIELNEALKSSKLRNLIDIRQGGKQLIQGIYGLAKVALDKVTDDMVITNSNPVEVYKKAKTYGNVLVFWISRNEKENPYTPRNSYGGKDIIPGNTLLAVSNGKNEMFDNHAAYTREYVDGKQRSKTTRSLKNRGRYPGSKDTVGVDKSHSTWSGTGLGNIKRIAEVSDECYIINLDAVRDRLSTSNKVSQRFSQKADATAFDNPKDIKQANITKYQSILAQRADNPDKIDKQVKEIIEDAHQFLMAGLAKKEMGDYNELSIGKDPKGRDIKPRDLTNYISNILSDYQGYVSAYVNAKTEEEKYGTSSDWYKRDAKRKALELKQRMAKWDNKNIVW